MGILNQPEAVRYSDAKLILGSPSGSALSVDSSDPNTTAPTDDRIFFTPYNGIPPTSQTYALVFADAACTLEGWIYSKTLQKWIRIFQQAITTGYSAVSVGTTGPTTVLPIPDSIPFFLRVQANSGSAKVAGIFMH